MTGPTVQRFLLDAGSAGVIKNSVPRTITLSEDVAWFERSKGSVFGGAKRMNLLDDVGKFPAYFSAASGGYTRDIDGNEYIDLIAGKGSVLLGHGDKQVDDAVRAAITAGVMVPLTPADYTVAAECLLAATGPPGRQVKFFRTGSCAVSAAVRIARAATNRDRILTCGYHGWHDWFMTRTSALSAPGSGSGSGEAQGSVIDFYYDTQLLRALLAGDPVAAVVVTPQPALIDDSCIREIAELTSRAGALLVLDEVKTGFRAGIGGYQAAAGIDPDLTTFSKAMGNGYPISALVGKSDTMAAEQRVHVSGTYETERIGLAAALACVTRYQSLRPDWPDYTAGCEELGEGANRIFADSGIGARFCSGPGNAQIIFSSNEWGQAFYRTCAARGLLFYCFNDVNLMVVQRNLVSEILGIMKDAVHEVNGDLGPCPPLTVAAVIGYLRRHRLVGDDQAHQQRIAQVAVRAIGGAAQ